MIEISISVSKPFLNFLEDLGKLVEGKEIIKEIADKVEIEARMLAPFDTGDLQDSIYTEMTDDGFALGANAPYAVFNEYGSYCTPIGSVQSPVQAKYAGYRPFLRPAMYKVIREFPKIFGKQFARISKQGMRWLG